MKKFYNRLNFNHINIQPWLQRWLSASLPCALCDAPAIKHPQKSSTRLSPLCTSCHATLPWYISAHCPQCALPTLNGDYCGICLQHPPAFDRTITAFRYAYPLDRLLQQFKYHQQLSIGKLLTDLILPDLPLMLMPDYPDVIVAMPMHMNRIQQRGFNHALELAKHISQTLNIRLDIEGCTRIVDTPTQAGIDLKTRVRNLRGAFSSDKNWQGKHVMVVDDVMTTGASMHAVAKVIKQAGAGRITALVMARTLKSATD